LPLSSNCFTMPPAAIFPWIVSPLIMCSACDSVGSVFTSHADRPLAIGSAERGQEVGAGAAVGDLHCAGPDRQAAGTCPWCSSLG
jgi:hypothetical protein